MGTESLPAVIASGLRTVFQPIVTVADGDVVAYEALARGPSGSRLELPRELFAAAQSQGRIRELDEACRWDAVQSALRAGLRSPAALFINVEPEVLGCAPRAVATALAPIAGELKVFFVKLDMSLIHAHPRRSSGEVMNGVCAYAEASGAVILAEGVERDRHLLAAQALSATLAQGWLFGRPGPLPSAPAVTRATATLGLPARAVPRSPVALVHGRRGLRLGSKAVLLSVSRALEAQAATLGEHAVVIANFQHVRHFTPATRMRFERLARDAAFTAALGAGMPDPPARGVRGAAPAETHALVGEWDLAVLGPHFAAALVARDLGNQGPDHDRRFEFVLTFDRELVIDVSAALIAHVGGGLRPARVGDGSSGQRNGPARAAA
jgi:EAL domain-containing protein (putative c-di-GMP-specific phosphodiesterase class I)